MNPHSELLEAGADPYNSASYDKYVQKEYANDLIFDRLLSFVDQHKTSPFLLCGLLHCHMSLCRHLKDGYNIM